MWQVFKDSLSSFCMATDDVKIPQGPVPASPSPFLKPKDPLEQPIIITEQPKNLVGPDETADQARFRKLLTFPNPKDVLDQIARQATEVKFDPEMLKQLGKCTPS